MTERTRHRASIIRWGPTPLGAELRLFVYDDADRFIAACDLEVGAALLRRVAAAVETEIESAAQDPLF